MSPRQTSTAIAEKVVKPTLPYKVTGLLPDGTDFDFPASKSTALKVTKDYMKQGFKNVTIWEHDGNGWNENTAMTEQARTSLQGGGNQRGVIALQQVIERSNVLVKMTGKAQKTDTSKQAYDAEVEAWLQQIGATCRALNVTYGAVESHLMSYLQQAIEA